MVEIKELPITKDENIRRKWNYLYAYNLKTIRDIFVYCTQRGALKKEKLYEDIKNLKIQPPKKNWHEEKRKKKDRLPLEYLHACEYLGLVKKEDDFIKPDFSEFEKQKRIIFNQNRNRIFSPEEKSPLLTEKEKEALKPIILNYERAKDFLIWFYVKDLSSFDIARKGFSLKDFFRNGKPLYILGKIAQSQKGSEQIKREIDKKEWKIPSKYIRLVNSLFPNWFKTLGIIDEVIVFPEFSFDGNLWHMLYPIKMYKNEFLKKGVADKLKSNFLKNKVKKDIWIPHLIYFIAKEFNCSTKSIKLTIEKLYKEDFEHFYLERAALQLMEKHSRYKESYIKVDGFYRSTLILSKKGGKSA